MIELAITTKYREGYKIVVPAQIKQKLKLLDYVEMSVYTDPSQVKSGDRLCFFEWVNATEQDRIKWKGFY
jgi:hypothetical protein